MFDIHQEVWDKGGERDEDKVADYIDGLMEEFAASPEAQPLIDSGEGVSWAGMMMEYSLDYCDSTPAHMSVADFNEVVFGLFPRKVSTEPESAQAIIAELTAFWQFVQRQYGLGNSKKILATLDASAAKRLQTKLADPSNYGMAKSFFMAGQRAGYDMTTQEGLNQFMLVYNSQILRNPNLVPPLGGFGGGDLFLDTLPGGSSPKNRQAKRKARKRARQARKRNRRK